MGNDLRVWVRRLDIHFGSAVFRIRFSKLGVLGSGLGGKVWCEDGNFGVQGLYLC